MAGAIIGSLRVALGLDSAEFAAGATRVEQRAARMGGALQGLERPVGQVNRSMNRLGPGLQNASYQMTDLVTQIQSGGSATLALSQQLPQLLGGLGAFGAVLGLVAGLMVPLVARTVDFSAAGDAAEGSLGRLVALFPTLGGAADAFGSAITVVADNLDRIAIYGATAAALFAGKYVAGLVAAAVATGGLSAALTLLRGALIRTGIGALIVGAGELVYQFTRLQRGAGGFGNAVGLLKDVAVETWDRITIAMGAIIPAMKAAAAGMAKEFYYGLSDMLMAFNDFLGTITTALSELFNIRIPLPTALISGISALNTAGNEMAQNAATYGAEVEAALSAATAPMASIQALNAAVAAGTAEFDAAGQAADFWGGATEEAGEKAGGAASEAEKLAKTVADVNGALESILASQSHATREMIAFRVAMSEAGKTAEELGQEKADIVIGGIDSMANAWGDFVAGGFRKFTDFRDGVIDSFLSMLKQMAAMAARNRILIPIATAMSGGAAGPAMAGGVPGMGGGGILGSIGGALGGMASGFGTGLSGFAVNLLGLNGAAGGIGGAMGFVGGALQGATASLSGFATALGALAGPVAIVAGLFMAFRKKTTVLDQGLRVTMNGLDALVETFERTRTTRLFGLVRNTSTDFDPASAEVANPIIDAYRDLHASINGMAASLGIGADAFAGFSHEFKLSLRGMTEEQQQAALAAEFEKIADALATTAGITAQFIRAGETASQALQRMSTNLTAANAAMATLGFSLFDVSLAGGNAASRFVELFGSLDSFASSMSFYHENFYSLAERAQEASRQFRAGLEEIGVNIVPKTVDQFRALVDGLMARGNEERAAGLIQLAPIFQQMLGLRGEANGSAGSAADAARGISSDRFSTRFGYEWAQASAAQRVLGSDPNRTQQEMLTEMRAMRQEQARMREENRQLLTQVGTNTRHTARALEEAALT